MYGKQLNGKLFKIYVKIVNKIYVKMTFIWAGTLDHGQFPSPKSVIMILQATGYTETRGRRCAMFVDATDLVSRELLQRLSDQQHLVPGCWWLLSVPVSMVLGPETFQFCQI